MAYYSDKIWTDGKLKLEEQLSHMVAYMEVKARIRWEERRIWEIEQQKEEEDERIRKELKQRQELELENFKFASKNNKALAATKIDTRVH